MRVDVGEGGAVHQLGRGGPDGAAGDRVHALGRGARRVEARQDGASCDGQRTDPHGRGRDDGEGALGADQQLGEVEAGDALDRAMPGAQQRAVGEDRLEAEHGLASDPVLRAVQPARVGRDVPADRGQPRARGIGSVEDTVRGEGGGEVGGDHPGLDHRDLVEQVDLADPGEPLQAQHDRAGARGGAAGEAGAGAARHRAVGEVAGQVPVEAGVAAEGHPVVAAALLDHQ